MIELARRYKKGFALLKDIAQCQDISQGYLEQILPFLRTAGLVNARRGACGGYSLAKPPSRITIGQVVRALEGDLSIVECVSKVGFCTKVDSCASRNIWLKIKEKVEEALDSFTLQDLIKHKFKEGGFYRKGGIRQK
jgi:Rrf2 family protein